MVECMFCHRSSAGSALYGSVIVGVSRSVGGLCQRAIRLLSQRPSAGQDSLLNQMVPPKVHLGILTISSASHLDYALCVDSDRIVLVRTAFLIAFRDKVLQNGCFVALRDDQVVIVGGVEKV